MSQSSQSEHRWVQGIEEWKEIPGCVGAIYDEDPELHGWILISAPDAPKFNLLKNRVFTSTLPVKKRALDSDDSFPILTTYDSIDEVPVATNNLLSSDTQAASITADTTSTKITINTASVSATPANDSTPRDRRKLPFISVTPSSKRAKLSLRASSTSISSNIARTISSFACETTTTTPPTNERGAPPIFNQICTFPSNSINLSTDANPLSDERRNLPKLTTKQGSRLSSVHLLANASEQYQALSDEQKMVHDFATKEGKNVFFTGSAGTGKSVVLRAIIATLQSQCNRDEVHVTASTGIAAVNIGGVTIHRYAHIAFGDQSAEYYVKKMENTTHKQKIIDTKYLIIDEISMLDGDLLDKLDFIFKAVRRSQAAFGGIKVIMTGDFFQLPPILKHGQYRFAFRAKCWDKNIDRVFNLKQTFRQRDEEFVNILNAIRVGTVTDDIVRKLRNLSRTPQAIEGIKPTQLFPLKSEVDLANHAHLKELSGEVVCYNAYDSGPNSAALKNFMAPEILYLKVNAQVMLLKNLSRTLVNGSIGLIEAFEKTRDCTDKAVYPKVRFANGEVRTLFREEWSIAEKGQITSRRQIPLLLAWALSIHKSQGQTLDYVKIDLANAFEKGQTYVALSRARSMENLQVLNFTANSVKTDMTVKQFYAKIEQ